MRALKLSSLVILTLLLMLTALVVHGMPARAGRPAPERAPLEQALNTLPGWPGGRSIPLSPKVVRSLQLDDYLFRVYGAPAEPVTLYIGFYLTAKKIGAADHPLVCYPGQGWQVNLREQGVYRLASAPKLAVAYSAMMVSNQDSRDLVFYWFQVGDASFNGTFWQKLAMFGRRVRGLSEENAFIRISVPVGSDGEEEARRRALAFVEGFYPVFDAYLAAR
jgi:EpsI family protein